MIESDAIIAIKSPKKSVLLLRIIVISHLLMTSRIKASNLRLWYYKKYTTKLA